MSHFKGFVVFWDDQGTSSILCEFCYDDADQAANVYPTQYQETDAPMHCEECHRPLECTLTDTGIAYVVDHIRSEIDQNNIDPIGPRLPWYENAPRSEVVADWCRQAKDHGLDAWQTFLVDAFLSWVPPADFHLSTAPSKQGTTVSAMRSPTGQAPSSDLLSPK